MKKTSLVIAAVVILLVLSSSADLLAQCAMCKATVTENVISGKGKGQGLNSGILYLMAFPYIIASVIGYFWYRAYKKKQKTTLSN
ncbi:MAG: hypothetical protein JWO58_3152 [Chitinophagaceae bacterium]|nr:hypothetical protein [Chitinophagaceae bacterium]